MHQAFQALDDVLTPHPLGPDTPQVIARRLRETGLIVLDGLASRTDVLALACRIMHITAHRDSESDGLTTIQDTGRHKRRPGFAGFTNEELAPHTERSGIPMPPRLMFMVCGSPADQGGECLLTDARAVHTELCTYQRDAAILLSEPRTAFFGAGDGHATQVFTIHPGGRVSVRLRLDGLDRWSPMVQPHVRHLRAATVHNQLSLRLSAGQGYVLDNTRWLHARTAFVGHRLCWRALGDPKFSLPLGFVPASQDAFPRTQRPPFPVQPAAGQLDRSAAHGDQAAAIIEAAAAQMEVA